MADIVKRVEYYYTTVLDRSGAGAKVMKELRASRVNLLALSAFPGSAGRSQIDFVPSNKRTFLAAVRRAKIKIVGPKIAFLIQGQDRIGATGDIAEKLAEAHINITAIDAISAGRRRYAAILWVKARYVNQVSKILAAS